MELKHVCPHCGNPLNDVGKAELEQFEQNLRIAKGELQKYRQQRWVATNVEKCYFVLLALIIGVLVLSPDRFFLIKMIACMGTGIVLTLNLKKKVAIQDERIQKEFGVQYPELGKYLDSWKKRNRNHGFV